MGRDGVTRVLEQVRVRRAEVGSGEAAVSELTVFEAALREGEQRAVDVTIIAAGRSQNRLEYAPEVLRASVPLWEGASAFVDHPTAVDVTRAGRRSLRDLAGVYECVQYDESRQAVRAVLRLYSGAAWAHELIREAVADRAAGRAAPNIGISADMRVRRRAGAEAGTWIVEAISAVTSADLVFQPSAGGSFDRILEESGAEPRGGGEVDGQTEIAVVEQGEDEPVTMGVAASAGSEGGTNRAASGRADGDGSRSSRGGGAIGSAANAGGDREEGDGRGVEAARASAIDETLEAARGELTEVRDELAQVREARRAAALEVLDAKLTASRLPARMRAKVRRTLEGRERFTAAEVEAEIAEATDILAELAASSVIHGAGAPRASSATARSAVDRIQIAVDRLFGLEIAAADSAVPRLSGIREAYLALTGDSLFTGTPNWEDAAVQEANEVTTSVVANVLANSMTKRIVADYRAQPKWWEPIVVKTSISDLKQQQRIHTNDFASLATVAENAVYTNLAWGDYRETYSPAKRGNLVVVTMEALINDDTHAIARIPRKLAAAGAATLNEFVAGLFTVNGGAGSTLTDTNNVFDAVNHQGNAGTAALSTASVQAGLVALLKMTNTAGKRLNLQGRYLLLPTDLYYAGKTLLESAQLPGGTNNDVNPIRGALTPISVPNWVDTNNWYVLCDPAQIEMLELGFLNGQEEPELLLQDGPSQGSVFTNDAISWKIRHIFGGGWLDYRGGYGAVVA